MRANLGRLTQQCEPDLQTFHGHLVDLGRPSTCTGATGTFAPIDRYEPWLRAPVGTERKFIVHTREMPARRGHEVSLITTHRRPRVLALADWTTIDGVNCACSEPRGLVRVSDVPRLGRGFVGMTAWLGDGGMALLMPGAVAVLAAVATVRWVARRRLAWRVDRAIDLDAWRTAMGPAALHRAPEKAADPRDRERRKGQGALRGCGVRALLRAVAVAALGGRVRTTPT